MLGRSLSLSLLRKAQPYIDVSLLLNRLMGIVHIQGCLFDSGPSTAWPCHMAGATVCTHRQLDSELGGTLPLNALDAAR